MTVSQRGTPAIATATGLSPSVQGNWGGATPVAGDMLVAVVTGYGNTTAVFGTTPSGWYQLDANTYDFGAGDQEIGIWCRVATGGDTAPTFTATNTGTAADCSLNVILYDLYDPGGTPVPYTGGDNFGTSGTITATTAGNVPSAGCFAVAGAIASQGTTAATTTWTTPSGWTLSADQTASATNQSAFYHQAGPASGATLSCLFTHGRTSTMQTAVIAVFQPPSGAITVNAVQSGAGVYEGLALTVDVVTGQAAHPIGATASANNAANVSITPKTTNSWVYGACENNAASTAFTPETGGNATTFFQNISDTYNGGAYGTFVITGVTTAGSAITPGASNTITSGGVAAVEIVSASTTIQMTEQVTVSAWTATATALQTYGILAPPGSLLVAMVSSDGLSSAQVSVTVAGGGLTWTQQVSQNTADNGYVGVWTAQVPACPTVPPMAPPAPFSPAALQQYHQLFLPQPIVSSDAGAGTDTGTVSVSDTDTGAGAETGGVAGASFPLVPPGRSSPMAWQSQPPTPPPAAVTTVPVSDTDTGAGAETGQVTATGPVAPGPPGVPPGPFTPMGWQFQPPSLAEPVVSSDSGTGTEGGGQVGVSGADSGSGADGGETVSLSGGDTGAAADQGGIPGTAYPLVPPGFGTPMSWQQQAWPTSAPPLVPSQDAGSAAETAAVTATVPDTDTGAGADTGQVAVLAQTPVPPLVPPAPFTPMTFTRQPAYLPQPVVSSDSGTGSEGAQVSVPDSDAGSAAETAAISVSGADTGAGQDQGGIPGTSWPLTPPGFASPMAWQTQAWPAGAPPLVPSGDTGAGAESSATTAALSDTDTGTAADTGAAETGGPGGPPGIPPGPFTPMAWQSQAPQLPGPVPVADTDTGSGADTGSVTAVPQGITGAPQDMTAVPGVARPGLAIPGYPGQVTAAVPVPPAALLIPPSPFTPMSWQQQAPVVPPVPVIDVSSADTGSGTDQGGIPGTSWPLTPPGFASPMAFQHQAAPSQAPLEVPGGDAGTAADTAAAGVSGADTGMAADTGGVAAPAYPLVPPGRQSPVAFAFQSWPAQAPPEVPGADTGTGADTGQVAAAGPFAPGRPLTPPGFASPMAWKHQAGPAQAPAEVPDTDAGAGTDSAAIGVSGADTGAGADTGGVAVQSWPLTPPGLASPMAWQYQSWPTQASAAGTGTDTGTAAEAGTVTATGPFQPGQPGAPPGFASPMAFQQQAWPTRAALASADADAGAGTDAAAAGVSDTDTGAGAEASIEGPLVQSWPLTPPGLSSPAAWQYQRWPARAPLEVPDADASSGADTATVTVPGADTGAGADTAQITAPAADTGTGADTASETPLPPPVPLTPPGLTSPMAWQYQRWPTHSLVIDYASGADTGTAAETATIIAPPAGIGIIQWLNPVRESEAGLNITLHLSQALGQILQFKNTGTERLIVFPANPGVTVQAGIESLVLAQSPAQFRPVPVTAGMLYEFGPFHTSLQIPGTTTIQVALSTAYGVHVLVVQGPWSH